MKSEILRRHADGRVTIRSTGGGRSKTTTVRLRPYTPPDPEAVAEALRDRYHEVADFWSEHVDAVALGHGEEWMAAKLAGDDAGALRLARGQDPFESK